MPKPALWFSAAAVAASLVWVTGCHLTATESEKDGGAGGDAGAEAAADGAKTDAGSSISCSLPTQFTCDEYPAPTAEQRTDVPVACASGSGELREPAACPTAGFKGKCTRTDGATVPGPFVERFYEGADVAYAQDFCVNTAKGTWSTTF